jgi:hypothetical protein
VVCGVWCVVCGVWCVVCGVWCVVCGVCVLALRRLRGNINVTDAVRFSGDMSSAFFLLFFKLLMLFSFCRLSVSQTARRGQNGWTTLHYAAIKGHADVVKAVLELNGRWGALLHLLCHEAAKREKTRNEKGTKPKRKKTSECTCKRLNGPNKKQKTTTPRSKRRNICCLTYTVCFVFSAVR